MGPGLGLSNIGWCFVDMRSLFAGLGLRLQDWSSIDVGLREVVVARFGEILVSLIRIVVLAWLSIGVLSVGV